jgi:hypothetical protein
MRALASICVAGTEGGIGTHSDERKDLNGPDELDTFDEGRLERVYLGGVAVCRLVLEPGWRSPRKGEAAAMKEWRRAPHLQYHAAGRIRIVTAAGHEFEAGPGTVLSLAPGYTATVIGDDPVVIVDFTALYEPVDTG